MSVKSSADERRRSRTAPVRVPAATAIAPERRFVVVTVGDLVEAVSDFAADASEAAVVVEHLLRRSRRGGGSPRSLRPARASLQRSAARRGDHSSSPA